MYYTASRYYDPTLGRFINADKFEILTATPTGLTDKNLYAYCDNNPVTREDKHGEFWHIIAGAVIGATVGALASVISQAISGEAIDWTDVGISAVSGALSGALTSTGLGAVVQIAGNALISGAESMVNQGLEDGFNNINYTRVVSDSVIGGIGGIGSGLSKGTAKHLMTQGYKATSQVTKKGLIKTGKYYFSQTFNLFYAPVLKEATKEVFLSPITTVKDQIMNNLLEEYVY